MKSHSDAKQADSLCAQNSSEFVSDRFTAGKVWPTCSLLCWVLDVMFYAYTKPVGMHFVVLLRQFCVYFGAADFLAVSYK